MSTTADENDEEEVEILHKSCTSCKNCPLCCYQILSQLNLLTDAYKADSGAHSHRTTWRLSC